MQENAKESRKKSVLIWTIIIAVIIVFGGYNLGYRFGGKYMIGRIGTVTVTAQLSNTSIFIDASQKIVTTKDNEEVKVKLSPNTHTFIISHDGLFPWTKSVDVPSGGTITLSPIFVSINTSGLLIGQSDPEYWKIKNSITFDVVPTKTIPRVSKDKSVSLWIEENTVIAKVGDEIHTVIQPETKIRNVDFYKDRGDAIIFSTSDSVYVIEINKEGTQNFLPIYKGTNPSFVINNANSIYVLDGKSLMQVGI